MLIHILLVYLLLLSPSKICVTILYQTSFFARNKLETRQRNFPVFHPFFFFSFLLLAFSILGKKQEKREEEGNTDSTTGSASFCLRQGKEEGKGKGACLTLSSQKKR